VATNRGFPLGLVLLGIGATALMLDGFPATAAPSSGNPRQMVSRNASGLLRTISLNAGPDSDNPFFQDLGTNGRRCVTCHQPNEAWTITPEGVQARFLASAGADPLFRNNDGSNCEGAVPASLDEQWDAYSLLLTRGLIRVGLDVPADAEFTIDGVADPYACAPATNDVSVYRRPLPSTNIGFLTAVMWDGRESFSTTTIVDDLLRQANNATRGHAEAFRDITRQQARQIVAFQAGLFTAQSHDDAAGRLNAHGARGGPRVLRHEPFFIGINDPAGLNPTGEAFDPNVFSLFDAWSTLPRPAKGSVIEARRAIARGQAIFNTRPITLSGVAGLNNETFPNGVTMPASFTGTCTVCHDSPNVGNHSVKAPLDIGLARASVAPYLPVYTLRNITTGETMETTDPGRAMVTGKWRDINRFKGPILRALAARAPYFHNGAAATLREVVELYDTRFSIGLTAREKADLEAFLRSL
jgi:cytochrome c peroxidase